MTFYTNKNKPHQRWLKYCNPFPNLLKFNTTDNETPEFKTKKMKTLLTTLCLVVLLLGLVSAEKYNLFFHPKAGVDKSNAFRDLNAYTMVKESSKMSIMVGEPQAQVQYEQTINKTGWATLSLSTNAGSSDEEQAFAAGFVEGKKICCSDCLL